MFANIARRIRAAVQSFAAANEIANAGAEEPEVKSVIPPTQHIPANVRTFSTRSNSHDTTADQPKAGMLTPEDVQGLNSRYLADALCQLGAWSALARLFSAYEKFYSRPNRKQNLNSATGEVEQVEPPHVQYINEFHAWNAATSIDKQMGEEEVILALEKMAQPAVVRGNAQTDAIIARVSRMSVEDLKTKRIHDAEVKAARRQEMLASLVVEVWNYTPDECNAQLSSIKAESKAVQTCEWIANTWTGDPANIAAELLLIEEDIKLIRYLARQEQDHEGDSRL